MVDATADGTRMISSTIQALTSVLRLVLHQPGELLRDGALVERGATALRQQGSSVTSARPHAACRFSPTLATGLGAQARIATASIPWLPYSA
jgi:hypothetical protein